jgi:di/tricarboxylate transporter
LALDPHVCIVAELGGRTVIIGEAMSLRNPGPMTYSGAALRAKRLRHRLQQKSARAGITPFVIVLLLFWWLAVTLWYPIRFLIWAVRRDLRKQRELREPEEVSRGPRT